MALKLKKQTDASATPLPSNLPAEPVMTARPSSGSYGVAAVFALLSFLAFAALLVLQLIEYLG